MVEFNDSLIKFLFQIFVIGIPIFLITSAVVLLLEFFGLASFNILWVIFISFILLIFELAIEILVESRAKKVLL